MTERENALRAFKRDHPEWIPNTRKSVRFVFPSAVKERVNGGTDWYGAQWDDNIVVAGTQFMNDISEWEEKMTFPDKFIEETDWEKCAEHDLQGIDRSKYVVCVFLFVGSFERMHAMMPFQEALCSFYDYPEETAAYLKRFAETRLKLLDYVAKYYKPDVIFWCDDYGNKQNLFFSPEIFRNYFKEDLKRYCDKIHEYNILAALHSCGKVDALIPDFIECGVDVWDSVNACNNLRECGEKYGKYITFSPGLDQQGVTAVAGCTEEDARLEVRRTIDALGAYGGLIIRPDQPRVPDFIVDICFDEIEKYGKTFKIKSDY